MCLKPWGCLGSRWENGSGVTQLMLFRQAVDMESEEPQAPEVMSIAEGRVVDIRCSAMPALPPGPDSVCQLSRPLSSFFAMIKSPLL